MSALSICQSPRKERRTDGTDRTGKWSEIEGAEDVLANILSRLPVEMLLELKLMSKRWHSVIVSPYFIDLQLRNSCEKPLCVFSPFTLQPLGSYLKDGNVRSFKHFRCEFFANRALRRMVCSFDGLIACVNLTVTSTKRKFSRIEDVEICVYNPATQKLFILPEGTQSRIMPLVGFCFGPKINDYKAFRFFRADLESRGDYSDCEVYSSTTGSWKGLGRLSHIPMGITLLSTINHVSVDGKVYWFIASEEHRSIPGSILVADLEDNFRTICLPRRATLKTQLVNLEGCLSVVIIEEIDFEVWVLRDCNKPEWMLRCRDCLSLNYVNINCVAAMESEIIFLGRGSYHIYDLNDKTWIERPSSKDEGWYYVVLPYKPSLLSCRGRLDPNPDNKVINGN